MNLIHGKLVGREESLSVLQRLGEITAKTIQNSSLDVNTVIRACDTLSSMLNETVYIPLLMSTGLCEQQAQALLSNAKNMLSGPYLKHKLMRELGADWDKPDTFTPFDRDICVQERALPLGVLLHIAAGNMEGLPAFTVIEGLLTGNINLLKLPGEDDGLSTELLRMLIQIEPALSNYIYVFDYPSEETQLLRKLANACDAIVIWGSDTAVLAVRGMAGPNTRLIEWGHKLSFAYVTKAGMEEQHLRELAGHICETNQLLCSSCQVIYIDAEDEETALLFCRNFLRILEDENKKRPLSLPLGLQAQLTLQLKSESLSAASEHKRLFVGDGVSVMYCEDDDLNPSLMFRNCLVKRLPRRKLVERLRKSKGLLQTASLLCASEERELLTKLLLRAGVVRVTTGGAMSIGYCGEPHDGEHSLRRYIRIASVL